MSKLKQQFTAVYQKRGKWYVGWVEEISGVNTQAKTLKELRENLKEALTLIIETNRLVNEKRAGARIKREPIYISA